MNVTPEDQPEALGETTFQDDSSSWMPQFTPGRLACAIALFLFILYPGVVLGTHSFFIGDYGIFTYPLAYYAHVSFWHGQVPLWNPLNNCGIPFLAQWNTSVCYPLSLIFLIFPLPQSLNYFCLGHLVLAGVGMYLLAYRWTENRLAASIAGLVFALNGLMLNSLMWVSTLAALSWQPWVTLAVEQAWRIGGSRRTVIAALAGAMQMLAGTPEIIVFTWTILSLLWLGQVWRKLVPFWPALRRFIIVVLAITGLSAIQLLPFFDLLKHSERSLAYRPADTWSMPLWGWANLVVPLFHCAQTSFGTFLQVNQPWAASYYPGIGTLLLALVAVWRWWRRPKICGLAGLTLAGLVLALGNSGYAYAWLKDIMPWIGFARYPIKFVSIPSFTLPLLAAYGFVAIQNSTSGNRKRDGRNMFLIASLLLLTIVLLLAAARWLSAPRYHWQWTWQDGAWRTLFLIAIVGSLSALLAIRRLRLRGFIGLAVLGLIGFDLVTAGLRVNPAVVTKAFSPLTLNMTSKPGLGESRAMLSRQIKSDLDYITTKNPLYYYAGLRGALFGDCNIPENVPKVDGFYPLHIKNERDIDRMLYREDHNQSATNTPPAPLLNFLGVSQISAPNTIFAWRERKSYLPLATAGQQPIFADDPQVLKKLDNTDFDPRHTVYLPVSERSKVTVTNGSDAKVISQQFGAQQASLTVEAPAAALVVVAQSYYHDWHAYVDGKPVPLLRANYAFQAMEIPAGRHKITLRYVDWMFRLGAMISALTLLGCLVGLVLKPKR